MYIISSKLHKNFLKICYDEYNKLPDSKTRKLGEKYDPKSLLLKGHDYGVLSENEAESTNIEESTDKEELTDKFIRLYS